MERLTITRKEATQTVGVGLNQLDALLRRADDPMPSIRVGKRVLIPVEQLRAWLDRQVNRAS